MWGQIMSVAAAGVGMIGAKRKQAQYEQDARVAQAAIDSAKASRPTATNPYINTTNLSGLATDLSAMMSNPFQSIGVATQAAEMQAEEADLALANTLDTLRASGASAGGATALAQAALRSKKGVSASLEQQEAQNEKLKAQGEQELQRAKVSEKSRIQSIDIGEGQRVQQAEAAGIAFETELLENRANSDMQVALGQLSQANQNAQYAESQGLGSAMGFMQGLGGLL
tara:strand:- start:231 stop:911 length:681 start_codon:yes stop_codon:yes gene_type:complete